MNYQTTACAVVVAVTVGVLYQRDISAPYNVTLINASQQPALQIKAFADHLQVEPVTLAAIEPTRSLELWALPEGGKPVSLGLLPEDGKGVIGLNPHQQASISDAGRVVGELGDQRRVVEQRANWPDDLPGCPCGTLKPEVVASA
ncbi:hypothetical protein BK649_09070 [Pseudomonas canadensis]|uniref:Anti-sigma K factor RskA C-terminal domain-containing protein n=1 Tax=Pseudomonas canadensis TaxID=915099 RepID=A0A423FD31_9PSED|nr:hypothetical protein BK649_09070 [Pseudomonas canadensis]